ncbi:MAG TPA: TadE/TadG family type IV pilus assembly protein [Rariglobus sp.]
MLLHRSLGKEKGTALVEFTLVLPILVLLLAMAIDFGAVLHTRFQLNAAVSAGANYALVHGGEATPSGASALARAIAALVADSQNTGWATALSVVNNGPRAERDEHGTSEDGSADHVNDCYCLTGSADAPAWGGAVSCGEECPSGGYGGRFILVEASRGYAPVFSNYGMVSDGRLSVQAVVQIQ